MIWVVSYKAVFTYFLLQKSLYSIKSKKVGKARKLFDVW